MVKTRLVEKKILQVHEYNSYRRKLIRLVRKFNTDEFSRIIYMGGKKIKWKDVNLEPKPCHYKTIIVKEEYDPMTKYQCSIVWRDGTKEDPHILYSDREDEPRGTLEDPVEVSSDED